MINTSYVIYTAFALARLHAFSAKRLRMHKNKKMKQEAEMKLNPQTEYSGPLDFVLDLLELVRKPELASPIECNENEINSYHALLKHPFANISHENACTVFYLD